MSMVAKGLEGVVANESRLSDVDGANGKLCYLGYSIDDLVANCTFEEVVYLLHNSKLPTRSELAAFTDKLRSHRHLPAEVTSFINSLPKDASPMNVLRTGVSLLGVLDRRGDDQNRTLNEERALAITGKEPGAEATRTLDVAYILHADHGMNASTFSARVTVATLSDMYSAITSAVGTLKGPLHGGANEGVIHMLQEIGDEAKVDAWVEERLVKKEKIMGIGHRVYKVLDPRAPHLQQMAIQLTQELGEPKWIRMSERIAQIMRERKGLNANVDFYSATVYYSLGIPTDLFTPIFAISRAAGWTAQVLEQLEDNRLYRPLTEYTGPVPPQPITPIDQR